MIGNLLPRSGMAAGVLVALVLSGCSATGSNFSTDNEQASVSSKAPSHPPVVSAGTPLSAQVSGFLAQPMAQGDRVFPTSYWGSNVELSAQARYFAASGRYCRQVLVRKADSDKGRDWLTCEAAKGQWLAVRPMIESYGSR